MPQCRTLVLLLALPTASSNLAHAQSSDTLGTVEVEGHYDNAIGSSDAASEGVVRGATIADRPVLRPGQVLETISGMVVTQHSGDGKANQYFLRGFNLDHGTDFGTWVGALPVNMPTNAHGQGYTDLNFLIPELIDSIDYRKGPYFANEGDFSSAGSAHINYKKSLDQNIADLTAGSYGYRRMLLAGSTELSAAKDGSGPILLGALELAEGNGPWTNPEGLRKGNALLRLSDGSLARGWSVDAAFYQAHWNSTDQVPLALIQSGQIGRFDAIDPSDGGDTGRAYLSGEWHTSDASGYTRISTYLQHYRLQLWSNFTFFENNPDLGDQFQQQESRNMLGGEVVRGWTHQLLGHDSITEAGFQVRHDDIDVSLRNTFARLPFETVSDDKVKLTETGLYLQNTTQWQPWFRSVFGLRQQFVDMSQTALVTAANSGSASDNKLLPKMSLIFGPWQQTEFFANYGQGFHGNDARGVIGRIDPTTGDPSSPVPALVGTTGWEFGARTEIIPGLQSSLALWRLDSGSELVYAADAGTTEPNGASKRYGAEWNNHMIVNDWLLLDADLAWTHARYVEDNANGDIGNHIPNAVSEVASIAATVRKGSWSGGLVTRYIGAYPLSQDGTLMAPSSTLTDLRMRRQITPKVALTFDVLNVFNRKYYDVAYQQDYRYPAPAAVVPDGITVHPGETRQLRVTLQVAL